MISALQASLSGKMLFTMLISMIPVVELRGGIPAAAAMGLNPAEAMLSAIVGNMIPVPFIILFVEEVFLFMKRFERTAAIVRFFEEKGRKGSAKVERYKEFGLILLVAVPLPGTGAWTGALVAALMGLKLKKSVLLIFTGVLIAAVIVSLLSYGIISLF